MYNLKNLIFSLEFFFILFRKRQILTLLWYALPHPLPMETTESMGTISEYPPYRRRNLLLFCCLETGLLGSESAATAVSFTTVFRRRKTESATCRFDFREVLCWMHPAQAHALFALVSRLPCLCFDLAGQETALNWTPPSCTHENFNEKQNNLG